MHERSETKKRKGEPVNVYGKGTPLAGQELPRKYPFEQKTYGTIGSAVSAAKKRSYMEGRTPHFEPGPDPTFDKVK